MNDDDRPMRQRIPTAEAALFATVVAMGLLTGCAQLSFPPLTTDQRNQDPAGNAEAEVAETASEEPGLVPEPQEDAKPGQLYDWSGDGRSVTRIVIDTNEQKARFYDGEDQIGWTTVASGVASHPTPRGEFT
ncbi:MAG: hypothetical protein WBG92_01425, partial [Thiohalocapsa sp.]